MLPSAEENERQLSDLDGPGEGFLYRYRNLVDDHATWVREIIQESILYFSSPKNFNDPFDCRARFSSDISKTEFKSKARDLLIERRIPRKQRRKILRTPRSPKVFASNIAQGMQTEIDRMGVLSLSATHENILMWSHYTCGHRGVCLQFKVTAASPFFAPALPVQYSEELPIPTLFGIDHEERVKAILFTKAADWRYEREWRLLYAESGPGHRNFPPSLLSGVILGANISPADRQMITDWAKLKKDPFAMYQAERHPEKYSLIFQEL